MDQAHHAARQALAARLEDERDRLQLKPDQLAELAGVHRSTVFNYLSGTRVPDALVLARMQLAAKVDVLYLLTGARHRSVPSDLSAAEQGLLERYRGLPAPLRRFVDEAALLSAIAHADRPDYAYGTDQPKGARAAQAITAPARKPRR